MIMPESYRDRECQLTLMLAVLLTLLVNGCSGGSGHSNSDCSGCHQKPVSCYIKKSINIKTLQYGMGEFIP